MTPTDLKDCKAAFGKARFLYFSRDRKERVPTSDLVLNRSRSDTLKGAPGLSAGDRGQSISRNDAQLEWVASTKHGDGYFDEQTGQASGWDSMWQRFMARLLKETKITERFTEHDLRGKVGSDAESLERARQLLGHADSKITERVYRRKPELVRPLR